MLRSSSSYRPSCTSSSDAGHPCTCEPPSSEQVYVTVTGPECQPFSLAGLDSCTTADGAVASIFTARRVVVALVLPAASVTTTSRATYGLPADVKVSAAGQSITPEPVPTPPSKQV